MDPTEIEWAKLAVAEARLSKHEPGRTPIFVGAVAVQGGKVVGAAHRGELKIGDHAEYTLLEKKLGTAVLAGSTIFATLEPCVKRSPEKTPCAVHLVDRQVKRVVIGTLDPNPDIRGQGILALRAAGIEVDFFPPELMEQLEELNRDFFRLQRAGAAPPRPTLEFIAAAKKRPLDQWYVSLNATYFHRNFQRTASDICLHLIEVIGGLSLLASNKSKPGVDKEVQVPKALAWWLALCGKVGVRSVEAMIWDKFPAVCPYCQLSVHRQDLCVRKKAEEHGPPWHVLSEMGQRADRPSTIGGWQRMFNDIYPGSSTDEYGPVFARLYEELAELAEAYAFFPPFRAIF